MLVGAVVALLLFLSVRVDVEVSGRLPNPTRTVSWEVGAQPWPWLSYDGRSHTGPTLHPLAGSWLLLVAAIALLALRPKKGGGLCPKPATGSRDTEPGAAADPGHGSRIS
jgi:hypothetical protein